MRSSPEHFSSVLQEVVHAVCSQGDVANQHLLRFFGDPGSFKSFRLLVSLNSLSQYHLGSSNWKDRLCLNKSLTQKQSSFLQFLSISTLLTQQGKFPAEICQITCLAFFTFFFLILFSWRQKYMSLWYTALQAPTHLRLVTTDATSEIRAG